jgi:hypothetical protein
MKIPNLRDGVIGGEPKHVDDTPMLNTTARESVNMNESNDNKEHTVSHKPFGKLGAKGRE